MDKINKIMDTEILMKKVFKAVKSDISNLFKDQISNSELIILKMLSENSELKLSEISRILNVSKAHLTAVTDTLDQKLLIERNRSENDRRVVNLKITPYGLETIKKLDTLKTNYFINKFENFSIEELDTLTNMLEKILITKIK
jgi:DNA-binding MarR family transcriptional regulator